MHSFTNIEINYFNRDKYLVIDNYLNHNNAIECQTEILNESFESWDRYNNCFEQKYTYRNKNNFPNNVNNLFLQFTCKEFIEELNKLTGYTLINDEEKLFYGIHLFEDGDKLDIHVDAGRHLPTNMIKAITLGLYLSYNWEETNGGHIEFWDGTPSCETQPSQLKLFNCKKSILPKFNRCIIFENNDTSWHGAPKNCICKNDEKRIFLTISYLMKGPHESFKNEKYKALFIKRPNDPEDIEKDKLRLLRANPDTCKKVYNINT